MISMSSGAALFIILGLIASALLYAKWIKFINKE
jgi:hypothetical protein